MKVISLVAENVKKLKAVRIDADGKPVVLVAGKNGAGKSSVLDSMVMALGGTKFVPKKPIRDGEEKAKIVLDLGEIKVKRTFTAKRSYLTVTDADGNELANQQDVLNQLMGSRIFDPLDFARLKAADRDKTLRDLVGLDFSDLDAQHADAFEARKDANKEIKRLSGVAASIVLEDPEGVPDEPVNVDDLVKELDAIQAGRDAAGEVKAKAIHIERKIETIQHTRRHTESQIAEMEERISELREGIVKMDETRATLQAEANKLFDISQEKLDALADPEPIRAKIRDAQVINDRVATKRQMQSTRVQLDAQQEAKAELEAHLAEIAKMKTDRLSAAKFPIEGLSLSEEDGVTYRGIPFDQLSQGEQIRVSTAVGLALNPDIRVLFVHDGALLDEDNLRTVAEMAAAADAQVWIETVERRALDGEHEAIWIEDGEIGEL